MKPLPCTKGRGLSEELNMDIMNHNTSGATKVGQSSLQGADFHGFLVPRKKWKPRTNYITTGLRPNRWCVNDSVASSAWITKCRQLLELLERGMKAMGEQFQDITNPVDCVAKCDEVRGLQMTECGESTLLLCIINSSLLACFEFIFTKCSIAVNVWTRFSKLVKASWLDVRRSLFPLLPNHRAKFSALPTKATAWKSLI